MKPLKLIALDADDLEIVSAHVQDAVLKIADIQFLPSRKSLILSMNRFSWETAKGVLRQHNERHNAVLHFDQVIAVQSTCIPVAACHIFRTRSRTRRDHNPHIRRRGRNSGAGRIYRGASYRSGWCVAGFVASGSQGLRMPIRLKQTDAGFEERFAAFLETKREASPEVDAVVHEIIADVRKRGDAALIELTHKLDRADLGALGIAVTRNEIKAAYAAADPKAVEALRFAHERIKSHHLRQVPKDDRYIDSIGAELGSRWTAVESVGLYVPGGLASYPSSVLMNATPAQVAGVERLAMVVPASGGVINPLVLVAADIAGITEIYRIGGAQAVAALAYGTETIRPVSKIVGPGNAYVAAAKRQVFGRVGIDMIAGPSEVLVVADGANDPEWIAADLIAQAEHGGGAQSILITDDAAFGDAVASAVDRQIASLPRPEHAEESWREFGAIIIVSDLEQALPLVDRIAAEHVELAFDEAEAFFARMRNAGAVFIGRHTPEVIGDYVGGSNHVLPTARSARFSSGLSVLDFVKRTSILKLGPDQLRQLAPAAIALAKAEGLDGHGRSVSIRLNM
jgi:histidinol dehydrogenase